MAPEKKPSSKIPAMTPAAKIPAVPSASPASSNGTAGKPSPTPPQTFPAAAPASAFPTKPPSPSVTAFPVDTPPEPKRGPGRPPKPAAAASEPAPVVTLISEDSVKGLIGMVSNLAAYGFSLSTGAPVEVLGKVWTFSEGEKAMLAPPTTELINKSAPEWLKRYETEAKLAFVAIPLLIAKLAMTHAIVKAHKEKMALENPTPSPTVGTAPASGQPTRAAA